MEQRQVKNDSFQERGDKESTKWAYNYWYTSDDIDHLLKNYQKNHSGVELLTAMLGTDWRGSNVLESNLVDFNKQRFSAITRKMPVNNKIIIPVNLNRNHWVLIYIIYQIDGAKLPNIYYFDPLGNAMPSTLLKALRCEKLYPGAEIVRINPRIQNDGFNCGPWIVEAAKAIVNNTGIPEADSLDIAGARKKHQQMLRGKYPRIIQTSRLKEITSKELEEAKANMGNFRGVIDDIYQMITLKLDTQSYARMCQVSKGGYHFFSKAHIRREQVIQWIKKITRDFNISSVLLRQSLLSLKVGRHEEVCKRIHQRLVLLKTLRRRYRLPLNILEHYVEIRRNPLLLFLCADAVGSFIEQMTLSGEDVRMWLHVSFFTESQLISKALLDLRKFKIDADDLSVAACSGNLPIIKYLLDSENGLKLNPVQHTLDEAAKSGSLKLVRYFLDSKNGFNLNPVQVTLAHAAKSGCLELVRYLLDSKNKFQLRPNLTTLNNSASSGNQSLVQYFLELKDNDQLTPDQSTLVEALNSGSVKLVRYLLDPKNDFELNLNENSLFRSATSGSVELMKFLLDPGNNFKLSPGSRILNAAASSFNFKAIQFLLDPKNNFHLNPNQQMLIEAAYCGGVDIMQHLLDPKHSYRLSLDLDVLRGSVYIPDHLYIYLQVVIDLEEFFLEASQGKFNRSQILRAYTAWPEHVERVFCHVLGNRKRYALSEDMLEKIRNLVEELKTKKEPESLSNESQTLHTPGR